MTRQIISIGSAPCNENCAQVGASGYDAQSARECQAFKRMLERVFPVPEGVQAQYLVKSFAHDFGPYREVCVHYEDTDARACEFAFMVEGEVPREWDSDARGELVRRDRQQPLHPVVNP